MASKKDLMKIPEIPGEPTVSEVADLIQKSGVASAAYKFGIPPGHLNAIRKMYGIELQRYTFSDIFDPPLVEFWNRIAKDIGGQYQDGVVRYRLGDWEITFDTFSMEDDTTHTRMRAPFVNKDGLYFKIYREGFFSSIGKFFGMQDIQIGDSYFDENFIINHEFNKEVQHLG